MSFIEFYHLVIAFLTGIALTAATVGLIAIRIEHNRLESGHYDGDEVDG